MEQLNKEISIERVILNNAEAELVNKWVLELNERTDGLIRFTKADVVNFLIENHGSDLSAVEVAAISRKCYDEAKWLGWGLAKIKAAKKLGESLVFDDLVSFRDRLLGSSSKPINRKAKKKTGDVESVEPEV